MYAWLSLFLRFALLGVRPNHRFDKARRIGVVKRGRHRQGRIVVDKGVVRFAVALRGNEAVANTHERARITAKYRFY